MLAELHLRGLGVIAEASVEFAPGLNVVTGETGVGKTLLVTSLALLSGARGQARLVAEGASDALVQAVVLPPPGLREVLADLTNPEADELLLARRLGADGRSRAHVDGQLVPVATLAGIGERLIELHGQGAGFALARPDAQLAAVDALARNDDELRRYREALAVLRALERERDALRTDDAGRARELDLLTYQLDEIERAAPEPEEDERLEGALGRLEHAEKLTAIGAEVSELAGFDGAAGQLAAAHKELSAASAFDPDVVPIVERLGDVASEATELARDIRSWAERMEADPVQLESLRERRALLATLKRKYGATLEDVLAFADETRARRDQLAGADERIETIDADVAEARAAVEAIAGELSARRESSAEELARMVNEELPALALPRAVFDVSCERCEPSESGADRVTFMFSSTSARSMQELGKIASGGELSRAMIAVTLALAQTHDVPVLVFDEADQGVGGEAALELARRLQRLGRTHQVLVVSHLPQIAAFADRQLVVRRSSDDVEVVAVDGDERVTEVSRMLAGLESSDRARAHAEELLALAEQERAVARPKTRSGAGPKAGPRAPRGGPRAGKTAVAATPRE